VAASVQANASATSRILSTAQSTALSVQAAASDGSSAQRVPLSSIEPDTKRILLSSETPGSSSLFSGPPRSSNRRFYHVSFSVVLCPRLRRLREATQKMNG